MGGGTALEGRIFTSLGFQPQAGGGAGFGPRGSGAVSVRAVSVRAVSVRGPSVKPTLAAHLPRLGLKPQAGESPPLQGGRGNRIRLPPPPPMHPYPLLRSPPHLLLDLRGHQGGGLLRIVGQIERRLEAGAVPAV